MKKLLENKFLVFTIVGSVIVFSIIAYALLSATATTKAAVLNADTPAGTTITQSMVVEIDVPRDTPGDFYKTADAIIGERLTSNVKTNQLIYPTNIMSSIDVDRETNENFITTSIKVADDNALGGLLTAGDKVDIAVAPNDGDAQTLAKALPEFNIDSSLNRGFYYILSNVTILDATTAVSSAQGSNMSTAQNNESGATASGDSSYYMISISYNDYKKLRLAEEYGTIYMNLVPAQNDENVPLIEEMSQAVVGGLTDASVDIFEDQREGAKQSADSGKKSDDKNKEAKAEDGATQDNKQAEPADTPAEDTPAE